jgi:hypothetical protein
MYVLAVGGGGGGGVYGSGGGGGGGVVMLPVYFAGTSSGSIAISVGDGGAFSTATYNTTNASGSPGVNTTVYFNVSSGTTPSPPTITGGGGGGGVAYLGTPVTLPSNGGSIGGGGLNGVASTSVNNSAYTFANFSSKSSQGGGGGAGTNAITSDGGNGIQCFLPGIKDFTPTGYSSFGNYYWGGGGGSGHGIYASGGLGGGGGGSGSNTAGGNVGIGGVGGITKGGNGTNPTAGGMNEGGAGGVNTGGGGGGSSAYYVNSYGNKGGSGIVVIAFPQTTVASNQSAVLPTTLVTSGSYNAVLNNASLTTGAYSSIKGAFACKLLNYNYFGPVMTLRHSLDTTGIYTVNFYADVCGNVGTGYLGTGQSVSAWLSANGANTTYAFVTKWYNQGMDVSFNSATQYTVGSQPIYDVAKGLLNFGYTGGGGGVSAPQTGCYLGLPLGTVLAGDVSYSVTTQHYNYTAGNWSGLLSSGTNTSLNAFDMGISPVISTVSQPTYYYQTWAGSSAIQGMGTVAQNNVLTVRYTGNTGSWLMNVNRGTTLTTNPGVARTAPASVGYLGSGAGGGDNASNAQLYYLHYFKMSISDADRAIIEATPYLYATPATIAGLATSSVTSTNFVLSWTAVSGASYYVLWINGSAYGTVTSGGTVTPSTSVGLWTLNLYAYSTTGGLLASGTTVAMFTAFSSLTVTSGWNTANLDVSGTSTYGVIPYTVFSFRNGPAPVANSTTTNSYTLSYTCTNSTYINCLIVGGGGTGGKSGNVTGGGGAGGVIMKSVLIPTGTNTMTINVGAGGLCNSSTQVNGSNSSIVFGATISSPTLISNSLVAYGGGSGASQGYGTALNGGSGGGGGRSDSGYGGGTSVGNSTGTTTNYNWGNSGGGTANNTNITSGGGGAGGAGNRGLDTVTVNACSGGIGIQCTLPGISQFTPSGIQYGIYYWGGGGSGASLVGASSGSNYGCGGLGGGGGDGNGINGAGGITTNATIGNGGANTGGGGGGSWAGTTFGNGGSGIVVIAFPTIPVATASA